MADNKSTYSSLMNELVDTINEKANSSDSKNLEELVATAKTIVKPEGTLEITENKQYDVSGYALANVNVASSGGIEIPSVTNLTCDSEGNVSWTAPNLDSLAEHNPIISYIVNINGAELEMTETTISAKYYLKDGKNTIIVKVKAIINHYDNGISESIEYSAPNEYLIILGTTLPYVLVNSACELVGDFIYIFGGTSSGSGGTYYNKILKFDTVTETFETLSVTLPNAVGLGNCIKVEDYVYIFGGFTGYYDSLNTILKFDPITETITTLSVTLPNKLSGIGVAAVNNYVYLIGGQAGYRSTTYNTIYKFDPITETIETLSATFPVTIAKGSVNKFNENIYLVGGTYQNGGYMSQTLYKFDTVTETTTTIIAKTNHVGLACSEIIGSNMYIFGGQNTNTISKFDIATETITTLSVTMPYSSCYHYGCCQAKNGVIYIFGGIPNTSTPIMDVVHKFIVKE